MPDSQNNIKMRPPSQVMNLERMGCFFSTRLSFSRVLLRRLADKNWRFQRIRFDINKESNGVAVYVIYGANRAYSLIAYSRQLQDDQRNDRVIASAWDSTFALFDGVADDQTIEHLKQHVPYQEAGRYDDKVLVLSRANRSIRLFNHVLCSLSQGKQPDRELLIEVGYLMRTTAVYGNGKFGICDLAKIADREEFQPPFQAEMLTVWLIRRFSVDLVEHLASLHSPKSAVPLQTDLRQLLGVGNSTGLGMAPFLVKHPALINGWISGREKALMIVRNQKCVSQKKIREFSDNLEKWVSQLAIWRTIDTRQKQEIETLKKELSSLKSLLTDEKKPFIWDYIYRFAEKTYAVPTQELLVSLLIEPYGELVDGCTEDMSIDESVYSTISGNQTVEELTQCLEDRYAWAIKTDYEKIEKTARVWYYSEEKMEPRIGWRHEMKLAQEEPLCYPRDVNRLYKLLMKQPTKTAPISVFLRDHPESRHAVRRVQTVCRFPYAEIQSNLLSDQLLPLNLLRCKLSFLGASRFDPRSDLWLRINLFQGEPMPEDILLTIESDCNG